MEREDKIIIHAEPDDVVSAILEKENISKEYTLKNFTYSMQKIIPDKTLPNAKEYKITHLKIELVK